MVLEKLKKSTEKKELQQRLLEKYEQTQKNLTNQLEENIAEVSSLKDELNQLKNEVAKLKETNKTRASLKSQLEEVKVQLLEQNKVRQEKEFEIIPLKEEMNKINCTNLKLKRNSSTLYDILSYQRSPLVKTGSGYDKEEY